MLRFALLATALLAILPTATAAEQDTVCVDTLHLIASVTTVDVGGMQESVDEDCDAVSTVTAVLCHLVGDDPTHLVFQCGRVSLVCLRPSVPLLSYAPMPCEVIAEATR